MIKDRLMVFSDTDQYIKVYIFALSMCACACAYNAGVCVEVYLSASTGDTLEF